LSALPAITYDYGLDAAVKAKKEGIQVCRLPLNEYGFFSNNTQVEFLNMRDVIAILDLIRSDCDWFKAFDRNLVDNNYILFIDHIIDVDRNRIRKLKYRTNKKSEQV